MNIIRANWVKQTHVQRASNETFKAPVTENSCDGMDRKKLVAQKYNRNSEKLRTTWMCKNTHISTCMACLIVIDLLAPRARKYAAAAASDDSTGPTAHA